MRFLQGKAFSCLLVDPALMGNLGTHTFPKHAEKPAHITRTSQNYSRQAESQQHPPLSPTGLSQHKPPGWEAPSGRAWRRISTKPLIPALFKPSLCHLQAPQTSHFQKRQIQPNLRSWAKANELLSTENQEIAWEEPQHSCSGPHPSGQQPQKYSR